MLKINGKTFMNIQEAVQWLLDNNALPFQSSANYVANTEIGMGTIVNPSPAKVRIGSLIFFADSKVSTVTGLTENGFICSDQYNDLVDDVVYVSNVALDASSHLIVTLSNGTNIDAGLIKQVVSFSINASQHLIANFIDGTSNDLGAIFSGNINISGDLTVTGKAKILENITDANGNYRFVEGDGTPEPITGITITFMKWSLSGTHLMLVYAGTIANGSVLTDNLMLGAFTLPAWIFNKIYPVFASNAIEKKEMQLTSNSWTSQQMNVLTYIYPGNRIALICKSNITLTDDRGFRIQFDLLIDNA